METSESWRCYRCQLVLPSSDGSRAPTTCLVTLGGCGRTAEECDGHKSAEDTKECDICIAKEKFGETRFFPSKWGETKARLHFDTTFGTEGRTLFTRLVETWEHYIEFGNPWHPKLLSLFVFQSYFYKSLPAVFYIGLTGPKATAKSAVLEMLRDLCYNGTMTFNTSLPAMARKLDKGCTLLVDEMDEMENDKKDLVQGAARGGYRPGNVYLRWDLKNHKEEEVQIFGPKAFSFITDIEDALKSRTVEIPTIRVREDPFGKVLANLARGLSRLDAIRTDIRTFCETKVKEWPTDAVLGHLQGYPFRQAVEQAVGPSAGPRDIEIAAMCLLVADMAGVEISADAKTAIESQAVFEDEFQAEFVEYVKQFWGDRRFVKIKELREGLNTSRKVTGEKPIHHKRFRAMLREMGMREEYELKRLAGEGNHILVLTEHAKKMLGFDDSRIPSRVGPGWFTEAVDSSQSREASIHGVKNEEERVKKTCEAIKALTQGGKESFTVDGIAPKIDLDRDMLERFIKKWFESGELYSPKQGEYRFA